MVRVLESVSSLVRLAVTLGVGILVAKYENNCTRIKNTR
jgi:hypothetical protein